MSDLTRDELIKRANEVVSVLGSRTQVYFKVTCVKCGERLTMEEPNLLREQAECCQCGTVFPILMGGMMLVSALHS
jgi:hypothetical protein